MRSFACLCLLSLAACDPPPQEGNAACDNLDESNCLFPFPSDRFRGDGKLALTAAAMPISTADKPIDPTAYVPHDGWSTVTPIMFYLDGATLTGAVTKHDIDGSLLASSKTLIIDAETGALWPHWAELDYLAEGQGTPVVILRTAKPLAFAHRYVVAIQGLVDSTGATLPPTRGWKALRDDERSPVVGLDDRRAHFDADVFPVLSKAGVDRKGVQLAWDFTTTTEDSVTRLLLSMREQLYAAIGDLGPEYTITKVEDGTDAFIAKSITGVAKVPSFLLPKSPDGIKRVAYDGAGQPMLAGTMDVEFTLQIPSSIWNATDGRLAAVLQYGHGFLGSKGEANGAWLRQFADERGFLILATDMEGMNEEAAATWLDVLPDDLSTAPLLAEWPHQGIMNHLALVRMMKGRFHADTDPRYTRAGVALYDNTRLYYHGNSQGGTIGNIQIATSRDITRAGLGVPGTAFSFLVHRATQWATFAAAIEPRYPGKRDMSAIMGLLQLAFDRFEPTYYIAHVTNDPFSGSPVHQVLLQTGLGDAQVNNDVSQLLARVAGAKLAQPAVRDVWGLDKVTLPVTHQNIYVEFDYHVPLDTTGNQPESNDTDTHSLTRKNPVAQEQMWHFFETGEIVQTCDGACDPD